jgi:membrane associated rhomboid family serine protease
MLPVNEPDLFVVCKNCGSEVSPYVTECPYCGQRVRQRAPKLGSEGAPVEPRRRVRRPSLTRLREGEIPGIAPETRPYATIALIGIALVAAILLSTDRAGILVNELGLIESPGSDWWRLLTTLFVTDNLGYLFITMLAVGIFGTHLERRFGFLAPIVVFLAAGAAGSGLSIALGALPALGANGAALGLLLAWLVEDRLALGRGEDRGNDLVGVLILAVVLILLALADPGASFAAAFGGAAAGAATGLILGTMRR